MQDLLHPHALGARVAKAAQVARGVGQPVGVIDAQPVEHAVAHQLEHLVVHEREDLLALDPHRGEVVDVEEAPVPAVGRVVVEDLGAPRLVGPPAVLLAGAHVVGHDVEHDPQTPGGERAQALLTAQRVRHARGIHDVVAVRRAAARLQRGRQVQVRDPQVAQVGDELADRGEVQLRRELQAVGRPQLAHGVTRRSSITDRAVTSSSSRAAWRSLALGSSGRAVHSSSVHDVPKRRAGSVKRTSS